MCAAVALCTATGIEKQGFPAKPFFSLEMDRSRPAVLLAICRVERAADDQEDEPQENDAWEEFHNLQFTYFVFVTSKPAGQHDARHEPKPELGKRDRRRAGSQVDNLNPSSGAPAFAGTTNYAGTTGDGRRSGRLRRGARCSRRKRNRLQPAVANVK